MARVHRYIVERLAEDGAHIDLFAYCPYHPAGVIEAFTRTSEDRKPRPSMAKAAQAALSLDLSASWVVGDQHADIGLAGAVGASAVYVGADRCERPGVLDAEVGAERDIAPPGQGGKLGARRRDPRDDQGQVMSAA